MQDLPPVLQKLWAKENRKRPLHQPVATYIYLSASGKSVKIFTMSFLFISHHLGHQSTHNDHILRTIYANDKIKYVPNIDNDVYRIGL